MLNVTIDGSNIAFAGAGGVGKTTLAHALCKRFGLNFLTSHIADIGMDMGLKKYSDKENMQLAFQWSILEAQIAKENALIENGIKFVTDRSSLDYIPYMIQKSVGTQEEQDAYIKLARANTRHYDLIVFIPYLFTPSESDLSKNKWKQRSVSEVVETSETIFREIVDLNVPVLCIDTDGVDNRMTQLLDHFCIK